MKSLLSACWRHIWIFLHGPELLPLYQVEGWGAPDDYRAIWEDVKTKAGAFAKRTYTDALDDCVKHWVLILRGYTDVDGYSAGAYYQMGTGIFHITLPWVRRREVVEHELLHALQDKHPELIGPGGDLHWPALFKSCRIPLTTGG